MGIENTQYYCHHTVSQPVPFITSVVNRRLSTFQRGALQQQCHLPFYVHNYNFSAQTRQSCLAVDRWQIQ